MDHGESSVDVGATAFPFHNLEAAYAKIAKWKRVATHGRFADLSTAVDLTAHPSSKRATFPGLTPFEILHDEDVLPRLVNVPSTFITGLASATFGAALTIVLFSHRILPSHAAAGTDAQAVTASTASTTKAVFWAVVKRRFHTLVRGALVAVLALLLVRFLRRRRPTARPVSHYSNCSRSSDGPCIVADRVLMITNSHAGTHADTPQHFSRLITVAEYDPAHYTGDAVVLDIREALLLFSLNGRAITRSVLIKAVTHNLPSAFRDGTRDLWRLLVVTRPRPSTSRLSSLSDTLSTAIEDAWDDRCAYFEPSAVEYLAETFPKLLLVGIDAPSVDDEKLAPIADGSHGAMLDYGIAILENLNFSHLEPQLPGSARNSGADASHSGCIEGGLLTVFNPMLSFEDSKGCCALFFPLATDAPNVAVV